MDIQTSNCEGGIACLAYLIANGKMADFGVEVTSQFEDLDHVVTANCST